MGCHALPRGVRLLAIVTLVASAACSTDTSSEDAASPPPMSAAAPGAATSVPPAPSEASVTAQPPPPTSPGEAALDAYRQMWAAMLTAAQSSDPDAPDLSQYATGEALAKLRYSLTADQQHGLVSKGQLRIAPEVADLAGTTAKITDCADDSEWLRYNRDGSPKQGPPGGRHKVAATATVVDGRWKVSELRVDGVGTC